MHLDVDKGEKRKSAVTCSSAEKATSRGKKNLSIEIKNTNENYPFHKVGVSFQK